MIAILFSAILSLLAMRSSYHAVHISYGSLTIKDNTMHGELTFFKDDWSKAIEHWYAQSSSGGSVAQSQKEVEYLKAHVRFWSGTYQTPLTILPHISNSSDLSVTYAFDISVSNAIIIADSRAIFTEYDDQMNLLTVKTTSGAQNLIFTSDHPTFTIRP